MANVNISDTGDNVTVTDLTPKHFPHYPSTQYLGVLIDAGRHYFPIAWLKDLMDVLQRMNYNFIHFRLTDDQAFNIQLESHPQLAKPSPVNNPKNAVYTIDDLTDLIAYADERNFTIMPEINVPGHAGAWAGYPNFVVPCPEFICLKGYGASCIADESVLCIVTEMCDSRSLYYYSFLTLALFLTATYTITPCTIM